MRSAPAVTAGAATDAGSEGGGCAEWQMVTRGKAKAGGPKRFLLNFKSWAQSNVKYLINDR
ncbi:hypothetical protein BBD39_10565 [Arsenophonus endosymbiont of Bemisia tabaci Asia II 3]|nr:hypothetical protein BBD39_10565 [Arsenophonus endosymbiont of Bemisia tabaci Asia II 3]